jgi:pimeloyl-ACP methyl ester carboxylesterase
MPDAVITIYIGRKTGYVIIDHIQEAAMTIHSFPDKEGVKSKMVPTPLGALSVRIVGHGPGNIVLWPSILTDSHIFDTLAQDLADTATFVLIDGPGHGQSPGTGREFSGAEAGRAMLAVMDALGLRRAVVGGVSWGGLTAAEVAIAAPDRVEALILMNTPMDIDGTRPGFGDRMIAFGARRMVGWKFFRDGVARSFFDPAALRRNAAYHARFHAMLAKADGRKLAAAVRSVILRGVPLRGRLKDLTVPTLVISGIADSLYPVESQAAAALLIPNGRFAPVPGHHISPIDAPDEVAALLRGLLAKQAAA